MELKEKVAVITGAGSGIGEAAAVALAQKGVRALGLADMSPSVQRVADEIRTTIRRGDIIVKTFIGNTTDAAFRRKVFDDMQHDTGIVNICVPAAGITRDALSVKVDKTTGKAAIYGDDLFRLVVEVNLIAPVYWALEMVARIAEDRFRRGLGKWHPTEHLQGTAVFIGSVSSQGNKGQIAYAATKRGLEGAASTLMKEAMFHGVKCAVIHPGFTDTPMVRAMGDEYIGKYILPYTQLGRLIRPTEIASAICFLVENSAVSGELWADAGWHPSA